MTLAGVAASCGRTGLFVPPPPQPVTAGPDASAVDAASEPPSGASDVRGQVIAHYTWDTGVADEGVDLTGVTIEAFAELAQGGFAAVQGSGGTDGRFVVPQMPDGAFLLLVGMTVLVHPARDVTLPVYVAGRPDSTMEGPGIEVNLDVLGLAPWEQQDPPIFQLQIFSSNAGCEASVFGFQPPPPVGATELTGVLGNINTWVGIDAMKGDRATLGQYDVQSSSRRLVRTLDLPSPELTGPVGAIQGTFEAVAPDQQATISWDFPAFQSYLAQLAPGAQGTSANASIEAYANTLQPALAPYLFFLPIREQRPGSVGATLVGGSRNAWSGAPIALSFGNPFPGWSEWVSIYLQASATTSIPDDEGGTTSTLLIGDVAHFGPISALGTHPLEPRLTPPSDVRIDGADAFAGAGQVSASPTFTWTPAKSLDPQFDGGTIDYVLTVSPVFSSAIAPDSGRAQPQQLYFFTSDPRVTIPPQLLTPGSTYLASIMTRAVAGPDLSNPAVDSVGISTAPFSR